MNRFLLSYALIFGMLFYSSCSSEEEDMMMETVSSEFTEYELSVIEYFKEVALGFEYGGASRITRKWFVPMRIHVEGNLRPDLLDEVDVIINEINELATDGFKVGIEKDIDLANFFIFLGSGADYAALYPSQKENVIGNWGLFSVSWDRYDALESGHMYVDTERANLEEEKHILREELTQALGLARDSQRYPESIFQSEWTKTTEYAQIDKDLISLLYHPNMTIGLNATGADIRIKSIFRAR